MDNWTREEWERQLEESDVAVFYLYTPLCGTCAVASKMMNVITVMKPEIPIGKADLNYLEDLAIDYKIESVPCLLIAKEGVLQEKVYAFHSVPDLLMKIS
ncbi:thioredoxin family protein [Sporosarcina sp. 6E9]|uniref:thioredoxin family protein n=1 Tax=Sporosarcina sp. 6E9 TaxID=2819235 RepID=UPI001AD2E93C|nr:thioredoxin family protein [Sporosarcina sp. 6E9]MBO1909999.1 thioredoxin family protein [Microvirga sp. 3-52]